MSKIQDIEASLINGMLATNLFTPTSIYNVNDPKYQRTATLVGQAVLGGSFNFSNSVLGRALGPNTPLEVIGNQQLAKELAYRVGSQLRNNVLPSINLPKLFDGDPTNNQDIITKPQYWDITKQPATTISRVLALLSGYEGNGNPFPASSNFNKGLQGASNLDLLQNSGLGTLDRIRNNVNNNDFQPSYTISKEGKVDGKVYGQGYLDNNIGKPLDAIDNSKLDNTDIDALNTSAEKLNEVGWVIGTTPAQDNTSLLSFTQQIVNDGADARSIGAKINTNTELYEFDNNGDATLTKGRNLKNPDGTYCRIWTKTNQYNKYENAIRSRSFDNPKLKNNSVLNDSGLLKIAPYLSDYKKSNENVKKYMFSIENLAYVDSEIILKDVEKGENGGRLMWFPPYELTITESAIANWNNVDFIGRNEPIYTYNNSERTATFGFKLIVDYPPNLINFYNDEKAGGTNQSGNYDKFFAGCIRVEAQNKGLSDIEKTQLEANKEQAQIQTQQKVATKPTGEPFTKQAPLQVYFDNNSTVVTSALTQNGASGVNNNSLYPNTTTLANYLSTDDGKKFKIIIVGNTSALNNVEANKTLGLERADNYRNFLIDNFSLDEQFEATYISSSNNARWKTTTNGETNASNQNSTKDTIIQDAGDRRVDVYLEYNPTLDKENTPDVINEERKKSSEDAVKNIDETLSQNKLKFSEGYYLDELKQSDPFTFEKYGEKIKYFDPVFHSQTPEDFNSRLTFLHQCTRQGGLTPVTKSSDASKQALEVKNSVFGRTPVCVLRIGDFFNTKIIIESIQFSYEPLIWDLNPEGIGVQPMICDVTMSCKIIGGQSLKSPVAELQNALSYKYYANTEVYANIKTKSTTTDSTNLITKSDPNVQNPLNKADDRSQTNTANKE